MGNYDDETSELKQIEEELRHCLKHVPAPQGFTDRVLARVAIATSPRKAPARVLHLPSLTGAHRRAGWWSAIAAALLMAVGGDMIHMHRLHQAQKEAAAQHEVDLAMQITNRALDQVGEGLEHSHAARLTQIALELSK